MNCKNCFNEPCDTMTEPDSEYRCHMTKEQRIQAEKDIIVYAAKKGDYDAVKTARRRLLEVEKR